MAKRIFWIALATILIFAAILEITPVFDGLLPSNTMTEFVVQYFLIVFTLCETYLALRLIKQNAILRIALLFVPGIANVICYHLFMNSSFLYLAVIVLVAFVFVYPAKKSE